MKLALDIEGLPKPGAHVLHFAPESGLARSLKTTAGENYDCRDLRPDKYPADLAPKRFDLTQDIYNLPTAQFDLIIHSHVMEHIPCNLTVVLYHLHRALKPGGMQVFVLPITKGKYRCDFGDLSKEQRIADFGHREHFRMIGRADIQNTIGMIFDLAPYDFIRKAGEEKLRSINIAPRLWSGLHGSTVFLQTKGSIRL